MVSMVSMESMVSMVSIVSMVSMVSMALTASSVLRASGYTKGCVYGHAMQMLSTLRTLRTCQGYANDMLGKYGGDKLCICYVHVRQIFWGISGTCFNFTHGFFKARRKLRLVN